jgi:hypothetical protein
MVSRQLPPVSVTEILSSAPSKEVPWASASIPFRHSSLGTSAMRSPLLALLPCIVWAQEPAVTCQKLQPKNGSAILMLKSDTNLPVTTILVSHKLSPNSAVTLVLPSSKKPRPSLFQGISIECPPGWRAEKLCSNDGDFVLMLFFLGPANPLRKGSAATSFSVGGLPPYFSFEFFTAIVQRQEFPFTIHEQISGAVKTP